MIVWALFDSGNGCYKQAAEDFPELEVYSIGIDRENKNHHFINLDLADYKRLFGDKTLFDTLDALPSPDLILASPPCESWSIASSMWGGNACWKQEEGDGCLFKPQIPLSRFTVRNRRDYDYENVQFKYDRSFLTRINGELCAYNTVEIIKRYQPKYYLIENPAYGRIWDYIEDIQGFKLPYKNLALYSNYDYPLQKATYFSGNIRLRLKAKRQKVEGAMNEIFYSYNERSNIPLPLVKEIYRQILEKESV